jgi:hypothetical protein
MISGCPNINFRTILGAISMGTKTIVLSTTLGLFMLVSPAQAGLLTEPPPPPPTTIPTPALLPGLLGLGLGIFRKRVNDDSNSKG